MKLAHQMSRVLFCLFLTYALSACDAGNGLSDDDYFQKAERAYAAGDLKASVIELKNALQLNPDSINARWLLGQVYLLQGDSQAAEKEVRRAIQLGAPPDASVGVLGKALLVQGKHQEVLDEARASDTMSPAQKADIMALRGQALLGLSQPEAAEAAFESALRGDPGSVAALLGLARIGLQRGDPAAVAPHLERALHLEPDNPDVLKTKADYAFLKEDYAAAEDAYRQTLQSQPLRLEARLGMLHAMIADNRLDAALDDLAGLLKASPNLPQAHYLQALTLYLKADYAGASLHATKVLDTLPEAHIPSLLVAGAAHFALGEYQQSYTYLTRFLVAQPNHSGARRMLATTQLRLNKGDEAAKTLEPLVEAAPDDIQLLSMAGAALVRSGDLVSGKALLKRAVDTDAKAVDASTRALLGVVQLQLGEQAEGLQKLEQVTESNPDLPRADMVLIFEYLRSEDYARALAAARRLQVKHPHMAAGHTLAGIALAAQGREAEAKTAFGKALEVNPGDPNAALNLAAFARKNGDMEQQRRYYQAILERNPTHGRALTLVTGLDESAGRRANAIQRLMPLVEKHPDAVLPAVLLGQVLLRDGQTAKALSVISGMLAHHPDNPDLLKLKGLGLLERGQLAAAGDIFRHLIDAHPQLAQAHALLAGVYERMENWEAMDRSLQAALAIQPDYPLVEYARARALVRQHQFDAADGLLAKLAEADQDHPAYTELRGDIALAQQRHTDAVALYSETLTRRETGAVVAKLAHAQWLSGAQESAMDTLKARLDRHPEDISNHLLAGRLYLQIGRLDSAADTYQTLLQRAPGNVIANNNLAWIEQQAGRLDQALKYAEKAHILSPVDPEVMDTLGMVLLSRGELPRAVDILDRAADLAPDNADIQLHLARALAASGRNDQAQAIIGRISPDALREPEELARLREQLGR